MTLGGEGFRLRRSCGRLRSRLGVINGPRVRSKEDA
jgi:hypothetical protein